MLDERLGQVEKLLSRYREQLYGKELAFGKAPDEDKARIKLQISDLKEEMQPYIQEYWDILSSQSTNIDISEEEAEIAVAEIVENTNTIELAPSSYSSDVLYLLREIRDKLNQPEESAVTKVKGVLSSFPRVIASYLLQKIQTKREKYNVKKK